MLTIMNLAEAKLGRPAKTLDDYQDAGLPFFCGCQWCHASLAPYNAYPTNNGFISCADCVDEKAGFDSLQAFENFCAAEKAQ